MDTERTQLRISGRGVHAAGGEGGQVLLVLHEWTDGVKVGVSTPGVWHKFFPTLLRWKPQKRKVNPSMTVEIGLGDPDRPQFRKPSANTGSGYRPEKSRNHPHLTLKGQGMDRENDILLLRG